MRTSKELILSSKIYTKEDRTKSWFETILTLILLTFCLLSTYYFENLGLRLFFSILTGLFYVRAFVIFHDYQHHAILQKSLSAKIIMQAIGIYLLAPQTIWKRTHDHHHNHNSKLGNKGIGSYPTITCNDYKKLSNKDKFIYLANRHTLTIFMGYFTLFIFWLNIKSLLQSPAKHLDSLLSLIVHFAYGTLVWMNFGPSVFWISFFIPYFIAFAMGSYLFYSQHNFPGVEFRENQDWRYDLAALNSTSQMDMNPFLNWMTGYIGYHHVHHLNSRIPFYRLKEAMDGIPELQHVKHTSWSPIDIYNCLKLKLWDSENNKMVTLKEFKNSL